MLHIGNIANNAYNNAKLLNRAGFDCDVLCYDYYHIMGCPEWEDADFSGSPGDDFAPEWWRVNAGGFERPRWFAQGPLDLAIEYLRACREGHERRARRLWRVLAGHNRLEPATASTFIQRFARTTPRYVDALLASDRLFSRLERKYARLARGGLPARLTYLALVTAAAASSMLLQVLHAPIGLARRLAFGRPGSSHARFDELARRFVEAFPERPDQLEREDVYHYECALPAMRRLLEGYDIVQAYSTDPAWPMLAGHAYFAFEHGTLRSIPFQPDAVGRLTSLSYHLAEHAFVTNQDCLDNAHRLAGERVTFINHPFDETHGEGVEGSEDLRAALLERLEADFLFFHPTRQDWVAGTGYADKANDIFLRAFAELRHRGLRVGVVCCAWGANVEESRALIVASGCERYVEWTPPMGTVRFERTTLAADCVVDQFKLGAFGGVMFKAIAVGRAVCTYLDEATLALRYREAPPVINCRSEEEIVEAMTHLIGERSALRAIGERAKAWMRAHHASADTVELQARRYLDYLLPEEQCARV
jgi:hypothetical protein